MLRSDFVNKFVEVTLNNYGNEKIQKDIEELSVTTGIDDFCRKLVIGERLCQESKYEEVLKHYRKMYKTYDSERILNAKLIQILSILGKYYYEVTDYLEPKKVSKDIRDTVYYHKLVQTDDILLNFIQLRIYSTFGDKKAYSTELERLKTNADINLNIFDYYKAIERDLYGDKEASRKILQKLYDNNTFHSPVANNLALKMWEHNNKYDAISILKKAIALDSTNYRLRFHISRFYLDFNLTDEILIEISTNLKFCYTCAKHIESQKELFLNLFSSCRSNSNIDFHFDYYLDDVDYDHDTIKFFKEYCETIDNEIFLKYEKSYIKTLLISVEHLSDENKLKYRIKLLKFLDEIKHHKPFYEVIIAIAKEVINKYDDYYAYFAMAKAMRDLGKPGVEEFLEKAISKVHFDDPKLWAFCLEFYSSDQNPNDIEKLTSKILELYLKSASFGESKNYVYFYVYCLYKDKRLSLERQVNNILKRDVNKTKNIEFLNQLFSVLVEKINLFDAYLVLDILTKSLCIKEIFIKSAIIYFT